MDLSVMVLVCCAMSVVSCQKLGEECITSTNAIGAWKTAIECRKEIEGLAKETILDERSKSDNFKVICCPREIASSRTKRQMINLRQSERKCLEYSVYVYEYIRRIALIPGDQPEYTRKSRCNVKPIPLIVDGTEAAPKEFPHMARLGYGDPSSYDWKCGGSIISRRFILTAAHCIQSRLGAPTAVRIGDLVFDRTDDDAEPETIAVDSALAHPNYKSRVNYHDIGLVKLVRKINFNFYIRPACLNSQFRTSEVRSIATGWGATEFFGFDSDSLLKVTLDSFTFDECKTAFQSSREIPQGLNEDQQMCAGSKTGKGDTCQGDSGGPLQIFHHLHCMYKVIGVTSFGRGCGNPGSPSVYTRVSNYIDWVEENAFNDD